MDAGPSPVRRPQASLLGRNAAEGWGPALVAMLLAGCLLLVGCAETAAPGTSSRSAPQAAVVPWAPLDPAYPTIPSRTIPARPDPAAARAAPPCRASDLRASSWLGAGLGTAYLRVTVRLVGSSPCRLQGHPAVVLLEGTRPVDVPTEPSTGDDRTFNYPDPVLVAPGAPAVLTLSWSSLWCTAPVSTDLVRVTLPHGRGSFTVHGFGRSPACNDPGSGRRSPVGVSGFAPVHSRPPRVVSRYDGVDVEARRTSKPRTGQPFDFTVTLTARRDVALDPCPDYTIAQYLGGQRSREDRYALDCADVPTKDAEGRPYLPAGRPVTFAMRARLLNETARMKFVWQLETPGDGAGAGLVVSGAG